MASRGYDEEIASIDARIEQLRARRRDEVARREQSERRAYNHACHALGEMVIGASGRDWRELEYAALDRLLRAALASAGSRVTTEATGTREATARLRAWERERPGRGAGAEEVEAPCEDDRAARPDQRGPLGR